MTIAFLSNFLNHHQLPVARELYDLTRGGYHFIATEPMPQWIKQGGYTDFEGLPLLVRAWESPQQEERAHELFVEADVALFAFYNARPRWVRERMRRGRLTFMVGERWLKRGLKNILSPQLLPFYLRYKLSFSGKPLYRLNASGFAAGDMRRLGLFRGKMYRWGYFTAVPEEAQDAPLETSGDVSRTKILSVARFLSLKHPELQVEAARRLRDLGYDFDLDMYGSGPELEATKALVAEHRLEDRVHFLGNLPNEQMLRKMHDHQLLLFTSDKNEGWGAVLNEAMTQGCVPVASDAIGAVPYLLQDGRNGMVFRSGDAADLVAKIRALLDDEALRRGLSRQARLTMQQLWNPRVAARRLVQLSESLLQGGGASPFEEGPCSPDF